MKLPKWLRKKLPSKSPLDQPYGCYDVACKNIECPSKGSWCSCHGWYCLKCGEVGRNLGLAVC